MDITPGFANPAGRKRTRSDSIAGPAGASNEEEELKEPGSPIPFVNTRYHLAGGMDTPQQLAQDTGMASEYSDVGYRRELSGKNGIFGESNYDELGYGQPLGRQLNGRPLGPPGLRQYHSDGWSRTALEVVGGVVGGVVGKVWEFCKTSAFRGFHAGGGRGYSLRRSNTSPEDYATVEDRNFWGSEKSTPWEMAGDSSILPGHFLEEDYIPNYMDHVTPENTPPRPAKRRQISGNHNTDEIARNWVVVPPQPSKPVASPKPLSKPQIPTPAARYSMPTASSASRRTGLSSPRPTSSASRAGSTAPPRRPALASRVSHAGSPALNSRSGASFASPRSSPNSKIPRRNIHGGTPVNSSTGTGADSPAAIEAKRWAAQKRKEEREADESIRRLDAQLKAMIREGKEALGSKVEIEIEEDEDLLGISRAPVGARRGFRV